jgi:hypothetical protein
VHVTDHWLLITNINILGVNANWRSTLLPGQSTCTPHILVPADLGVSWWHQFFPSFVFLFFLSSCGRAARPYDTTQLILNSWQLIPLKFTSNSLLWESYAKDKSNDQRVKFFVWFWFWDRVFLCSPGWPWTLNPPSSASQVLESQVCATTPSPSIVILCCKECP